MDCIHLYYICAGRLPHSFHTFVALAPDIYHKKMSISQNFGNTADKKKRLH